MLKLYFDFSTSFRIAKLSVECSFHICSCPWIPIWLSYFYQGLIGLMKSDGFRSFFTVVMKWERHKMSIWTYFYKIWIVCSCRFKVDFIIFWCLYHLHFDLKTINHHWWLILFEKKSNRFWREIWIQVLVILLQQ